MDPGSIAAISIGVSVVVGAAGACLVPLCRKQKKSVEESSINDNSDVVVANYEGTSHWEISCACCKIVRDKQPNIEFNSKETDRAANALNATNQSGGSEQFISKQPGGAEQFISKETGAAASSALASAATAAAASGATGAGATSETTASDPEIAPPTLTNQPLIFNDHNNSDDRNSFMVKNLQIKSDGSCSADEINLSVARPLAFSPSNTHMGRAVAETILLPMRDLFAHFVQLKVAAIAHNAAYVAGAASDHSNEHSAAGERPLAGGVLHSDHDEA